jgi:tRNA threonylcarbamoyladenosine biosynthesis protein TsaB
VSETTSYILCIETANAVTSAAISKNGECLVVKEVLESNKAADKLHVLIADLLAAAGLSFADLNAVAISAGPGSYTGLRIAAAAAKGYCFSLDIPLISISTLEAMVEGIQTRYNQLGFDEYVPMIDARRMEVFTSFYTKEKELLKAFTSLILDDTFENLLDKNRKYMLFGNGAEKATDILKNDKATLFSGFIPSAQDLCSMADASFQNEKFEDVAYFEPHYLKAFFSTQKN